MFFFFLSLTNSKIFPEKPSLAKLKEREKRIDEFEKMKYRKREKIEFFEKEEKQSKEETFLATLKEIKESQHNENLPMFNGSKIISKKHEILKKRKNKRPKITIIRNTWNLTNARNIRCDINISVKQKSSAVGIPRNNPTSLSMDFPMLFPVK